MKSQPNKMTTITIPWGTGKNLTTLKVPKSRTRTGGSIVFNLTKETK